MEKYKISQVAKKFDVSRTALIHYDKCGLLEPSYRGKNKYRLYTRDDLDKLELILALKESGLTLKEIQTYLSGENKKSSLNFLSSKRIKLMKSARTLVTLVVS
ncbi:MerR family transcriptional regulator [Acidaminobacter sp. JC074]|uniref:MerR family transcriptional regulator n=1 Tax=Acidaminobacter sp. JC074 TaxID=2530199 RepID=UPI001F0F7476|nr:MerR family transcriptional regulator [Acidaminobacter sp. JC074]